MNDQKPLPWQQRPVTQLLAVLLTVVPIYSLVIWSAMSNIDEPAFKVPDIQATLIQLVVLVIGFGGVIVLVLKYVCGESLSQLNLKYQESWLDLRDSLLLVLALVAGQLLLGIIAPLFAMTEIPDASRQIARALADDRALLLIWLGPIIWLQAGVFEEFMRVFMLSRLWNVWPSSTGRWVVLYSSAILFGLGHLYQGPFGMFGTFLIGLILGYYYMVRGRVIPLIISHALYDTTVVLLLVYAVRIHII